MEIALQPVTRANWSATLRLEVSPEQQRFVADHAPIAAIALAKAYVRPGGAQWLPFAILAGERMVGFIELACEPDTADEYWIFHFFIDHRFQRRGYGRAALDAFIRLVRSEYPRCANLRLVVHPENLAAQRLYASAGFTPTGAERWGEPVYQLSLREHSGK